MARIILLTCNMTLMLKRVPNMKNKIQIVVRQNELYPYFFLEQQKLKLNFDERVVQISTSVSGPDINLKY